jgi:hypothetical protein
LLAQMTMPDPAQRDVQPDHLPVVSKTGARTPRLVSIRDRAPARLPGVASAPRDGTHRVPARRIRSPVLVLRVRDLRQLRRWLHA